MRRSHLIKAGFKCLICMTLINSCPTRLSSREQRNIAFSIAMCYDSYHLFQWAFLRKCGQIEVTHVFPLTGAILSNCVLGCNIPDLKSINANFCSEACRNNSGITGAVFTAIELHVEQLLVKPTSLLSLKEQSNFLI